MNSPKNLGLIILYEVVSNTPHNIYLSVYC